MKGLLGGPEYFELGFDSTSKANHDLTNSSEGPYK